MYQAPTQTPERTIGSMKSERVPRARRASTHPEAAWHLHELSGALREPVRQRTIARIADAYEPIVPSSARQLAQLIDYSLLDPMTTPDEIQQLCREAAYWRFGTVCVNSRFVSLAVAMLENTGVWVCATIAFPFGAMSTEAKVCEARSAVWDGALEVDAVLPIGLLKSRRYEEVFADILYVRQAVDQPARLRVVLETGLLTSDEMIDGALIAVAAGADFIKTSTGFTAPGPSPADVRLLRDVIGGSMGIKVDGTIHTWDGVHAFLRAGASRIGTSRGVEVMTGYLASRRWSDRPIDERDSQDMGRGERAGLLTRQSTA